MNLPPDGFEDENVGNGPPDGFADVPRGTTQTMGMMDTIGSAFKSASNQVANTPMGMISGTQETINEGANRLGEKTATSLAQNGLQPAPLFSPAKPLKLSPEVSAGIGTGVAMAPDILSMVTTPIEEAGPAIDAATPFARRSLGFQKSLLKTPFARGQATKAAESALENNIIPRSGNPEVALDNAVNLANKSGERIGQVLKNVPADVSSAMDNLETARQELTKGFSGGLFQKANGVIDDVKQNLQELFNRQKPSYGISPEKGQDVSANVLNQIKTRLARSINYLADLASQSDNKTVVNSLANSIRDSVRSVLPPEEYASFIKDQKLFNTAELMKKGLNNEVAKQMGNHMFSPYSVIPAAGELAAGNPGRALGALGVGEGVMRRGSGMTARAIQDVGTNAAGLTSVGAKAVSEPLLQKRTLTDEVVARFMAENNDDPKKAAQAAEAQGYSW